ncbi:VOC family protein [Maritalea mediterranea]|uniref:VOC family protein n=1 Tax=Maritalea mediterranea TaxID=2909667 RepID=A0ABS9E9C5_9HYPH|nr:VOC family protein [Maritalea mediterranea]MCF4099490.1 VOC family protein [Maritalea mediterranea]
MPTSIPCLWFNHNAEDAARFYCDLFEDGEMLHPKAPTPVGEHQPVMVRWRMNGQEVFGLNGGGRFPQSESFSFFIEVRDQAELDHYWEALLADGGQENMCGWLKDRFGVSWQVIPKQLGPLVGHTDPAIAKAATEAMFNMRKIIIADLEAAADAAR